ncbi:MAG: hypothetical protein AB7Q42_16535 [Acidimicrobiia bacterium]
MMKRVTWFAAGMAAGAAGSTYAARKVKKTARALKPSNVARSAVGRVKSKGRDVAEAVRDGREAMRAKEAELRTRHDRDGAPPRPGQVIVLEDVRDANARRAAR